MVWIQGVGAYGGCISRLDMEGVALMLAIFFNRIKFQILSHSSHSDLSSAKMSGAVLCAVLVTDVSPAHSITLFRAMHVTFCYSNLERAALHQASRCMLCRANAVFAVIAFLQSAVWLSQIADEVVALFQAIGTIFSVADDLLGATVLAWGETVPDLMAMIAVARVGALSS